MAGPSLVIDLDAIAANWRMMRGRVAPAHAAAVVKADAYGLGAAAVGRKLAAAGCQRFYVAWPEEGVTLREAVGANPEILVFHGPGSAEPDVFRNHALIPVLNDLDQIALWRSVGDGARPAAVHVNTGMNRLGLSPSDWGTAAEAFPAPVRLISHLACGDESSRVNAQQLARFQAAAALWPGIPRSLSASGGVYLGRDYHFDEVRTGIALYGGGPAPPEGPGPQTVVTVSAPVLQVRQACKGETVGYGASWTLPADTRLATLGIGYADGFIRAASNRGKAYVNGQACPIVGRVSMDLIVVDIGGLSVNPGDDIELIGPNMPLSEIAGTMGTIDYEILTRLGARFSRRYAGAE